jgi:hypothetical protein
LTAHLPHLTHFLQAPETRDQTVMALETILAARRTMPELAAERRQRWQAELAQVAGFLRQAQAAGELDPAVDADTLAVVLQACVWGLTLLSLELAGGRDGREFRAALAAAPALLVKLVQRLPPPGQPRA